MPIPQTDKEHNDVIDFLADACMESVEVRHDDDTISMENRTNPEIAWWKTGLINSNRYGRFAKELKDYEHLAPEAYFHMSKPRADHMYQHIMQDVESFKRSADAKSAETRRNKNNSQSSLVNILSRNKQEREYVLKDEAKKSIWAGLVSKDMEKNEDSG